MNNKKRCILSLILLFFVLGVSIPLFMTNNKKVKADSITNLTGTTWTFNNSITVGLNGPYSLNFMSNNNSYTTLAFVMGANRMSYDSTLIYYNGWQQQDIEYRTITITGGNEATQSSLINWLQNNATMQTPPPPGTQITHKYWGELYSMLMTDNQVISDDNISYKVLYNQYTDVYNDETLTGLTFTGYLSDDEHTYIMSIDGSYIVTLFQSESRTISNVMWLEFTPGDYMDDELYDFLDNYGVWFDDPNVYLAGSNMGSIEGFNRGRAYGQQENLEYSNLVSTIFNNLSNILNIQVFPNITIALLIGLPLLLGVFIIIIKILRG